MSHYYLPASKIGCQQGSVVQLFFYIYYEYDENGKKKFGTAYNSHGDHRLGNINVYGELNLSNVI